MGMVYLQTWQYIACGEGGMVTTNNEALYKQLLRLRSHGITKGDDNYTNSIEFASGGYTNENSYPGWYMEMQQLGYNYRLTDSGLQRRKEIAEIYFNALRGKDYIIGQSGVVEGHAYHLYVIEAKDRLNLYKHLRNHNIFAQIHYIPTHIIVSPDTMKVICLM